MSGGSDLIPTATEPGRSSRWWTTLFSGEAVARAQKSEVARIATLVSLANCPRKTCTYFPPRDGSCGVLKAFRGLILTIRQVAAYGPHQVGVPEG